MKHLFNMKSKLALIMAMLLWVSVFVVAPAGAASSSLILSWQLVGEQGFSQGQASYTTLATDGEGVPYIAYSDGAIGGKVSVKKFVAGAWQQVGTAGFSASGSSHVTIALDNNNVPYVAYSDSGQAGKASVMKFNGTAWVLIGTAGFTAGGALYGEIALNSQNVPYVAYQDEAHSKKVSVMAFVGGDWQQQGTAGFTNEAASTSVSLAIDSMDNVYVAYQDVTDGNKVTVMSDLWGDWSELGVAGFSDGAADRPYIAVAPNDDIYVIYKDAANEDKATVKKFTPYYSSINDLTATAGELQIVLNFSAPSGADSVILKQSEDGGNTWSDTSVSLNASSTTATITGLEYGQSYSYQLIVQGGSKHGTSNQASAVPYGPIDDLVATAGNQQVSLTFSSPTGADSVTLQQSVDSGTTWTYSNAVLDKNSTTAMVTGLDFGYSYRFRLVVSGGDRQGISNLADSEPYKPIDDLAAAVTGSGEVSLSFSQPTGANSAKWQYSEDAGATWTESSISLPATSATIVGLDNGTSYTFQVIVDGGARHGTSNVVTAVPYDSIDDVAAEAGNGQVTVTFSAPTGAVSVTLQQSTDSGVTWTNTSAVLDGNSTTATVTGLVDGTSYSFRVLVDGGDRHGTSNVATAMPSTKIDDLAAVAGNGQVSVTFSAPSGATSVTLEQSADSGVTWVEAQVSLTAASTSATVTGLNNGTSYSFQVIVDGGARHGTSNVVSATPSDEVEISDLKADMGGDVYNSYMNGEHTAILSFSAPTGATSVEVEQKRSDAIVWSTAMTYDLANQEQLSASSTSALVRELDYGYNYEFRLVVTGGSRAGTSNVAAPIGDLKIEYISGGDGTYTYEVTFSEPSGGTYVIQTSDDLTTWATLNPTTPIESNGKYEHTVEVNYMDPYFRIIVTGGSKAGRSNIAQAPVY